MAEFIRVPNGLVNLDHIVCIEHGPGIAGPIHTAVIRLLGIPAQMRIEGAEDVAEFRRNLERATRGAATRSECEAWSTELVRLANELVGSEPTAEKRRQICHRLVRLSDNISPTPIVTRRAESA